MKKELNTSITINASKKVIWDILLDFEKYHEWNTFILSITGEPLKGNRLNTQIEGMKFKPTVLKNEKEAELRWLGKFLISGLIDGEHQFKLIDNGNGSTLFEHSEKFSGILVGLFAKKLDVETKIGFERMNEELKKRAEKF